MASIIQLKRSSVSGRVPDASNVTIGEPVVNLSDQIIYTKNTTGSVIVIGAGTTSNIAEGTNLYFTNTRARAAFTAGTNITIVDGVISSTASGGGGSGGGANVSVSTTEPTGNVNGDFWLNTDTETFYIYNGFWREFAKLTTEYDVNYFANNYSLAELQYGLEHLANVNINPASVTEGDMLIYNGTEWVPSRTAKTLKLTPSTSAPSSPSAGTFATAQPPSWDPGAKGGTTPYPVFYNGSTWVALY